MCNAMNKNYQRIFLLLMVLFISLNTANGMSNFPSRRSQNHSVLIKQILNRTRTTIPSWKRSNSIEILKRLIASRQIFTKYNRTLFFTNSTQRRAVALSSIQIKSTTQLNFLLFSSSTRFSNVTILAIIFVCCFTIFLTLIFTYFLQQSLGSSYLKLPCIHSLSTGKQSRNSTPLSYSPIDSKHQEGD